MAKDNSLFPLGGSPLNVGVSSEDLFASPKPVLLPQSTTQFGQTLVNTAMRQAARQPTEKELKAQDEAERARQVGLISDQLNQMRAAPEWRDASLDKRNIMYKTFLANQYTPAMKNIQDPSLRKALGVLPPTILKPDITNLASAIDDSSWFGDAARGAANTTTSMSRYAADQLPAMNYQYAIDKIQAARAAGRAPSVLEIIGNPLESGTVGMPTDVIDLRIGGESWDAIEKYAEQEKAKQLTEARGRTGVIKGRDAQQSIGAADRRVETAEDKASYKAAIAPVLEPVVGTTAAEEIGTAVGTLVNAATNPSTAFQLVAETSPTMIPTILAGALGGAPGVAGVSSMLSGQDATSTAIEQVQMLSDEYLQQLAPYRELREAGASEQSAKDTLSLRAGQDAQLLGNIIGLLTGPLGVEAGVGKMLNRVATGTISDVAEQTAARVIAGQAAARGLAGQGATRAAVLPSVAGISVGAAAKGVGRTALEGVEEGATQVAANLGQQQATGGKNNIFAGVGEAAAQGIIAGAPLGGGSEAISAVRDIRAANKIIAGTTTEGGTQNGTVQNQEGQITDIPDATQAASQQGGTPDVSPVADPARVTEAVSTLRSTFDDLRSRGGQSLTGSEYSTLMEQLHNAETVGVSATAIQSGLDSLSQTRALPEGNPSGSLFAAYQSYVNERTQADAQPIAADVATTFSTGDFINGRTDAALPGADYTGVANSAGFNSEMGTNPTGSRLPATTVSQDAGGINSAPQVTGDGGASSNNAPTDAGNQATDGTVGAVTGADAANSRPDNQPISGAGTPVSVSERVEPSSAGQRATDGGGTTSASSSTSGSNISVGGTVTYQAPFRGSKPLTGSVASVNQDGTFNLSVNNGQSAVTYANLPRTNIKEPANAVQKTPAEATATERGAEVQNAVAAPVTEPTPEVSGTATTPGGRDIQRMDKLANDLFDMKDGHYAAEAIELSKALESGNYAQADTIADYLYSQGLRAYKPATINIGSGKGSIDTAFTQDLNGAERLALQREFDLTRDELPPELATFGAFRDAMVHDTLLVDSGASPLNDVFARISQTARAVFSKLARALAAVIFAISLSNTFPVNDAMAAVGSSTVHNITQTQGLSATASTVNSWVREVKDNAGQRYIIADKASGEIHIMDSSGKVLATAPALYGSKTGDGMSVGETPTGIFTLQQEAAPTSYGGDIQQFATASNGDVYAIHRVLTSNPKQNRLGRLASKTADDNRVSLGCINVPIDMYNKFLSSGFKGKLYIIPDQKELGQVFKGIEEVQAKQELTEGSVLPQDMGDQTSAVYESSTDVVAEKDPTSLSALAVAAADASYGIATSDVAAKSNFPADNNDASAVLFMAGGLFGIGRARRNSGSSGTTGGTGGTPPAKNRKTAQENFHSISDETPAATASGRPTANQRALQSATAAIIERLSDADHRFIQWTDSAGMVGANADYNSAPLVQSLKRIEGTRNNILENARASYIKPLERIIRDASARLQISPDVVARDLGTWTTLEHIPEENARMREGMVLARDGAMFTADAAVYNAADETLRAFDAYQAGTGPRVATAGGFTDSQATAKQRQIESYGYSQEELRRFQQHIVTSIPKLTTDLVAAGVLMQAEVDSWPKHKSYVPLYVVHEQAGGDVYIGAGEFTTGKTYRREGAAKHYASHAYVTFQQYIFRAASAQASAEFRYGLHTAYKRLKDTGDTHGLQRVNMASSFIPQEAKDATGIFYRESDFDSDGNLKSSTYKYFFADSRIMDGLRTKNAEPSWGALKLIAKGTRGYGMLATVARPVFAPIMWFREGAEKTVSLALRYIYDADGNLLSSAHTALRVGLSTFNPINVAAIAKARITGDRSSPVVRALDELKALGGLSMYQQMLQASTKNMQAELKALKGWRRIPKGVMAAMTAWNGIWAEASSASAYMALRNMGVTEKQAAFRVLDTFNVYNRGAWKSTAQALYPFVGAAFEGGRNVTMSLSTPRGRKGFVVMGLLSVALYALLSSLAPDDDDSGNMLDGTKLAMLGNSVPVFFPDGSSVRVPVGFGTSKLAWILGAGAYRLAEGVDTIGDVASAALITLLREMQPLDAQTASNSDGIIAGIISAMTPTLAAPIMQIERNLNAFGNRIYGNAPPEGFKSDAARSTTPQVWTDIAQAMQQMTGMDSYPESIRHMATSYLVGPFAAITTALESDTLYTRGGNLTTKQELGPMGVALGIQSLWDNGDSGVTRKYFELQENASNVMRKYHVSASDAGNRKGEKAVSAGSRVLEANGSMEEALLVEYAIQAETDRQKQNTDMKKTVGEFRKAEIDLESLSPEYEVHAQEQERLMRGFIRQARGLK